MSHAGAVGCMVTCTTPPFRAAVRLNSGVRPHMTIVEIQGWQVGFNKVACTNIIRAATGIDLVQGKAITDGVLSGETQRVYVSDNSMAQQLVNDLTEIGAIASIAADGSVYHPAKPRSGPA
ncbi:hypothetical protein GCM10010080_30510 [Thermomonas carbonis]|nr:hypothetical protein GCM10010080_30510 [Thermomonas carbonis]